MGKFRFEDLEIWEDAINVADSLFDIVDMLKNKKLFSFADQLQDTAMSMLNNIAEGSGSHSKRDFINFLNIAKRSILMF
jgi:four helix bundle protein